MCPLVWLALRPGEALWMRWLEPAAPQPNVRESRAAWAALGRRRLAGAEPRSKRGTGRVILGWKLDLASS